MDLFFDTLTTTDRRRTHFHRFMHELHVELGRLKHRANPLEVVAHRIARRTRVSASNEFFVTDIADAMLLGTLFAGSSGGALRSSQPRTCRPSTSTATDCSGNGSSPAIELIEANVDVVQVDHGVDYRLRQLERRRSIN